MNNYLAALNDIINKSIRKKYHLVTNGLKYRIETEVNSFFWFKRKIRVPVIHHTNSGNPIINFYSKTDAERYLEEIMLEEASKIYGWHEVPISTNEKIK